jgi:hypothetical protein
MSEPGMAASEWQRRVEDTWLGHPVVFDADGQRQGFIAVSRTVRRRDDGSPEIVVTNDCDFDGPVFDRIAQRDLVLRITEADGRRIYDGRDFHGGGTAFGRLLLGQDFIIPWGLETVVAVQVLPDGITQCYSNLAYQGPRLIAVIGGVYATGVSDADEFAQSQRRWGSDEFTWGGHAWSGEVEVHDGTHSTTAAMRIDTSTGQLHIEGGGFAEPVATRVTTTGAQQQYEGPDVIGNAMAYGPMLFGTRHLCGRGVRVTTRDVLLDHGQRLAVAYQHHLGGTDVLVVNGVLEREQGS